MLSYCHRLRTVRVSILLLLSYSIRYSTDVHAAISSSAPGANQWVHMPERHRASLRTFRNYIICHWFIVSIYGTNSVLYPLLLSYLNPLEAWQSQVVFYLFPNKLRICPWAGCFEPFIIVYMNHHPGAGS